MRRIEWLIRAALVFCLLYAGIIAVSGRANETFPFFAWDLFSKVPSPQGRDYSIRIDQAQGLPGPFPVYFENANLQNGAQEIQGYFALQVLGQSTEGTIKLDTVALRKNFESTYLAGLSHARYALVKRTYDIRKRVTCPTCFTGVTVLGEYTTG
jgi:hypothetical protein